MAHETHKWYKYCKIRFNSNIKIQIDVCKKCIKLYPFTESLGLNIAQERWNHIAYNIFVSDVSIQVKSSNYWYEDRYYTEAGYTNFRSMFKQKRKKKKNEIIINLYIHIYFSIANI